MVKNENTNQSLKVLIGSYDKNGKLHDSNEDYFKALSNKINEVLIENNTNNKTKLLKENLQYLIQSTLAYYIESNNISDDTIWFYNYDTKKYTISSSIFEQSLQLILNESPADNLIRKELRSLANNKNNSLQPKLLDDNMLAAKNVIVNIDTKEIIDYSVDIFVKSHIDTNYNPNRTEVESLNGQTPLDIIKSIANDNENRYKGLLQILRQSLLKRNLEQSIIFLVGEGGSGKSTFVTINKHLIGEHMVSPITINQLDDDKKAVALADKHILLGDDLNDGIYMDKLQNLKTLSGGGLISVDRKYLTSISFKFEGLLIQSMANIAKMNDRAGQMSRRVKPYIFEKDFTKDVNRIDNKQLEKYFEKEDVREFLLNQLLNENITPKHDKWIGWDDQLLKDSTLQNNPMELLIDYVKNNTKLLESDIIPSQLLRHLYLDINDIRFNSDKAIKSNNFNIEIRSYMKKLGYEYESKNRDRQKKYINYLHLDICDDDSELDYLIKVIEQSPANKIEKAKSIESAIIHHAKTQIGPWTYDCLINNAPSSYFFRPEIEN